MHYFDYDRERLMDAARALVAVADSFEGDPNNDVDRGAMIEKIHKEFENVHERFLAMLLNSNNREPGTVSDEEDEPDNG